MVKMDLKVLFSQLKPSMALKMLLFTAFNKLLNPYGNIFYGFSAEDQVILTLLGYPKKGFYVDVGCNHPVRFSNTFMFYMRGWNGLTLDANSDLIDLHKKIRPKDISVCCAVSDHEKDVVFTKFTDNSMSSISSEFVREFQNAMPIVSEEVVKTRTLSNIFIEHKVPNEFEFLSIDVEGHDFEVLRSVNLAEYKPRLIVLEMRKFSFKDLHSNQICSHLDNNGYKLSAFYNINGFFLRNDLISSD